MDIVPGGCKLALSLSGGREAGELGLLRELFGGKRGAGGGAHETALRCCQRPLQQFPLRLPLLPRFTQNANFPRA